MKQWLTWVLLLSFFTSGCSPSLAQPGIEPPGGNSSEHTQNGNGEPEPFPPLPNEFEFSTKNYPVTLCGSVSATGKDPAQSEYVLTNGDLVVYLRFDDRTAPELIEQLRSVNAVFPYGSPSGCIHGRRLPYESGGRLEFLAEKGAISISSGGISVSN